MTISRLKIRETIVVLVTACIVFFLIFKSNIFIYIALGLGIVDILFSGISKWIAIIWLKFGEKLGSITSFIILSAIFYFILFPVSLLYRIKAKDFLKLKRKNSSYFEERNYTFTKADLENPW